MVETMYESHPNPSGIIQWNVATAHGNNQLSNLSSNVISCILVLSLLEQNKK